MRIVRRFWLLVLGVLCLISAILIRALAPQSYFTWSFVRNPPVPFWIEVQSISEQWLLYVGLVLISLWVGYWFAIWRAIRRLKQSRSGEL